MVGGFIGAVATSLNSLDRLHWGFPSVKLDPPFVDSFTIENCGLCRRARRRVCLQGACFSVETAVSFPRVEFSFTLSLSRFFERSSVWVME